MDLHEKLDAILNDIKYLRMEIEPRTPSAAEQARVKRDNPYTPFCRGGCGKILSAPPDCGCYCNECRDKPAPVVERFVMWDLVETNQYAWAGHVLQPCFRRVRRGDVVATEGKITGGSIAWDWTVRFNGDMEGIYMTDAQYRTLKRKKCFGDQV